RFAVISKPQRIYRRVGGPRPGDFGLASSAGDSARPRARPSPPAAPSRQIELAELCRRMVLEAYGPAAVLINRRLECLYFQGPVDRYLKVMSGRPVNDVIAMAREGVRTKLRSAVQRSLHENAPVVMPGGRMQGGAGRSSFRIVVVPAPRDGEDLLLVCFVEEPEPQVGRSGSMAPADVPRVVELERELEAANRIAERCPQPRDLERRADGDQRGGAVRQRGISIDKRGAAGLQGRASIAQRGADRAQQPIAG